MAKVVSFQAFRDRRQERLETLVPGKSFIYPSASRIGTPCCVVLWETSVQIAALALDERHGMITIMRSGEATEYRIISPREVRGTFIGLTCTFIAPSGITVAGTIGGERSDRYGFAELLFVNDPVYGVVRNLYVTDVTITGRSEKFR